MRSDSYGWVSLAIPPRRTAPVTRYSEGTVRQRKVAPVMRMAPPSEGNGHGQKLPGNNDTPCFDIENATETSAADSEGPRARAEMSRARRYLSPIACSFVVMFR